MKSNSFLSIVGDVSTVKSSKNSGNITNDNDNANASASLHLLSLTFVTHTQRGPINLDALALETAHLLTVWTWLRDLQNS